jgi:condensin complex subunit 2
VDFTDNVSGSIPFNTQFFHADYEDATGLPDDDEDPMSGAMDLGEAVDDLLASGEDQRRRVRPEFVNYAKRAKRVDVRKLKENIWKGLDIKLSAENSHDKMVWPLISFY